jgi:hypothetical protein
LLRSRRPCSVRRRCARGVCVYRSCSFPREHKGHGLRLARPYAAHGRRGREAPLDRRTLKRIRDTVEMVDNGAAGARLASWSTPALETSAKLANTMTTASIRRTSPRIGHRSLRFHPVMITTVTPEARAARLACRTLGSHTRPVLDASRPRALDLLCRHGLATVS